MRLPAVAVDETGASPNAGPAPTLAGVIRRLGVLLFVAAASVATPSSVGAQPPPPADPAAPAGRVPLVEVPVGCPIQPLPDVVFVGTVVASDFRTVRFRIDQPRAGDIAQFAAGELVDVRYAIDAKYLTDGTQYLIAARYDPEISSLRSRVRPEQLIYGGDEIIGATESELECPEITDPLRTMHVDGGRVDSGLLTPFVNDRQGLLRALVVPLIVVLGAVFALASARWILTGFGRGVESLAVSSSNARAERAAPGKRRPVPASAGGPSPQRAVGRVGQRSLHPGGHQDHRRPARPQDHGPPPDRG